MADSLPHDVQTPPSNLMGSSITAALPMALAIALFPVPIIAMVLILTTDRARVSGPTFALGWIGGLGAIGAVVLVLADSAGPSEAGAPADWISWVKLALAGLLLVVGWKQIRPKGKPKADPAWMAKLDSLSPGRACVLGAALAALNPKNLLLAVAGATEIAQGGLPAAQQVVSYAVFVACATVGIAVPLGISVTLGDRSDPILESLKNGLTRHMSIIVAVLCGLIALKLVLEAVRQLAS